MGNPLNKRFSREIKANLGKYLGMFLMMVFATAFTSGFLLAASSIEKILGAMDDAYAIEDGHFTCDFEVEDEAVKAVEDLGVSVTNDYYNLVPLSLANTSDDANGMVVRVYPPRETANMPAYAEGREPKAANEIALDRVFATENHGIAIGDTVEVDGKPFTVCGILTFPDHQALFRDNTSFMFDAITYCVGTMTEAGYRSLNSGSEVFNYSYTFNDQTLSTAQRTDIEEDIIDVLNDHDAVVNNLVDKEDNQGIGYALDDVRGDQAMWTVLLFVLVIIMAFVFVVLTGATIEAESSVIGTMLASGWRKREIVLHYLVLPTLVGALGAGIGLAIGVNFLTDSMRGLYYHSYSIPPYHTIWDWKIVFLTAVVPFLLLVGITLFGLTRKMRFTPLQFLRHEVSSRKRNASLPLPDGMKYPTRFRLRVLLRNASHFATLFFGIIFASLLLLFGTCMLPVVQNYAGELMKTVAAPHQYALKTPLELEGTQEDRDRYAAALRVVEDKDRYETNRASIDAAKRLEDNKELMDALERLQDNDELMNALDRLQDNDELMDALDRLQNNDKLMDALEHLEDNKPLMDALERLQDNKPLMDAIDRLKNQQDLVDAARRLQNNQALVDAAERLENQTELMYWLEWAQLNPAFVEAATRVAAGLTDPHDLANVAALSDQEKAGLRLIATMDAQTKADIELAQGADSQTKADMELVQNIDEQTKADLELLDGLDQQAKDDIELMKNVDDATQADIDLLANLDEATQRDIDVLRDVDDATQADIDLLRNVDDATQADIDLLHNVDDATQADIDLVREMDDSLLDDVRLAADIDEDTHVVNTQINDAATIAQAEKYAIASLEIERAFGGQPEEITVYGIQPASAYWTDLPVSDGRVVAGRGLIEKTKAEVGETVAAHNKRKGADYPIAIAEQTDNEADTNLYMTLDDFNALFGEDADYFNGYASAKELALDTRYTAQHIQPTDMLKMSDQLETSMGKIMYMMMAMAVPIYLILVYLLTKTVIDRSARSISYMKVFGYQNKEVNGLYIRPITYWVLFCLIASLPLIVGLLTALLRMVFMSYSGNFPLIIPGNRYVAVVMVGFIAYAVVAFLHVRRIKKVPLELAMKVQE